MKDSGKWAVVFTVLNIILIAACVVLLLGRDRKAPAISFSENDLIYYNGIDNEKLLQGVTAMDAKDGDVSDRIVVEKIVQNKNENRAVVYYAVTDLDGNAAKASRVFEAVNESTGNAMKDIGIPSMYSCTNRESVCIVFFKSFRFNNESSQNLKIFLSVKPMLADSYRFFTITY